MGVDVDKTVDFFKQIVDALVKVKERGIVHRDLKPENILLNSKKDKLKIIDWGAAYRYSDYDYQNDRQANNLNILTTKCGTESYVAPDIVLNNDTYNGFETDVWSLGVIILVTRTGVDSPFHPEKDPSAYGEFEKFQRQRKEQEKQLQEQDQQQADEFSPIRLLLKTKTKQAIDLKIRFESYPGLLQLIDRMLLMPSNIETGCGRPTLEEIQKSLEDMIMKRKNEIGGA